MISVQPVSEQDANQEIRYLYADIKHLLQTSTVPLMFQYLAVFQEYLADLWDQARYNISHPQWKTIIDDLVEFSDTAMDTIYTPHPHVQAYVSPFRNTPQLGDIQLFTQSSGILNANLYILTVAMRESLKGKYLGLKQMGQTLSREERERFNDLSEGISGQPYSSIVGKNSMISTSNHAITGDIYQDLFRLIEQEMTTLKKLQIYLACRVELEKFTLSKLSLLPSPINSSFALMAEKYFDNPQFSELIYLVSEVFPTQTPYKLLATSVMKKALK